MITGAILLVFISLASVVFSWLPVGGLPTSVNTSFQSLIGYLYVFNGIFPIDTLMNLLGYSLIGLAGIFAFKAFLWLISFIPGE